MLSVRQKVKLVAFAQGIFVCYAIFGIFHEKIFKNRFGTEINEDGTHGERFTYAVAFVALQCIVYAIFSKVALSFQEHSEDETNQRSYFTIAICYVAAMVTSNMALKWISYPAQVISKATKPIPVMLLSVLIGKKSYAKQKYLFVLVIVIGVGAFIFKDGKSSNVSDETVYGYALIGISLLMDGLVGAFQDRMRADKKPSTMHFMLYINSWSSGILICVMAITGEGRALIEFAIRHPTIIWQMALCITVGTLGQVFICAMVSNFGSLPLSIVTTTRKMFTVFVSVIFLGNEINLRQWIAVFVIFTALFLDSCFSKKSSSIDETATTIEAEPSNDLDLKVNSDKKEETEFNI